MNVSVTLSDDIGDIKMHHTYNGAAPYSRGWMLCDGDVVNQANYDAQHGAGAYVRDQVALSPLAGKHLPVMTDRYVVGATSTTATGSTAIPTVGNSGNTVNLLHRHVWYKSQSSTTNDSTFLFSGEATISPSSKTSVGAYGIAIATSGDLLEDRILSHSGGTNDLYTADGGQNPQSIQPDSVKALYLMKVI